jgi:exopolysaccharide production protein ExoY
MFDMLKKMQESPVCPELASRGLAGRQQVMRAAPIRRDFYAMRGKRALDVTGALVLLIVFSPLILVIALLMLSQRGPVLFGHQRIGQAGALFACLKFRTMVPDAEARLQELLDRDPEARRQWQADHKLDKDPRITPVGNFLRRTSLDELPQLLNVLRGDMSLVGPRPVTRAELQRYGEDSVSYLALRPGLTGKWQVSGRNDISYAGRVALDAAYAREFSACGDLAILVQTVGVVLGATGK